MVRPGERLADRCPIPAPRFAHWRSTRRVRSSCSLRSADGGNSWSFVEGGTLPVHLEAGVLRGDPNAAQVWYVGFSLMPYAEVWRRAEEGTNLLSQVDPLSLAGLAAFLVLLLIGGALLARHLSRAQRLRAP